jgi:hypothetical protein
MTGTPDPRYLEAAEIAKLATPALDNMAREAMTASGRHAARRILLKRERAITASMRRYLDLETLVSVRLRRPRWMPGPVYRWLLRTIIFEEVATR